MSLESKTQQSIAEAKKMPQKPAAEKPGSGNAAPTPAPKGKPKSKGKAKAKAKTS